jgi:hypothetical protein
MSRPGHRSPVQLQPLRRWSVYLVGIGLWVTGVLWLIYHYYMTRKALFGMEQNPLEQRWLALHGLFGFASLWMIGLLWGVHILAGWRSRSRRWTGGALLALLFLLIVSGYLIYYPPGEESLPSIAEIHWITGLALPLAFLGHRFLRTKTNAAARKKTTPSACAHASVSEQLLSNSTFDKYQIRDGTDAGGDAPQSGARRRFFVGLSKAL